MITASVLLGDEAEAFEAYGDVRAALRDIRRHWMESSDPEEIIVLQEGPWTLATILRDPGDHTIMTVYHADGFIERHRCEYVSGADGRYLHTKVTALVA